MGLTSWKGGVVRKGRRDGRQELPAAKTEIDELNRIVVMFLDFAEDQARRRKQIFLQRLERRRLDEFLQFNDRNVLARRRHESAAKTADAEGDRRSTNASPLAARAQIEAEAEADALKQLEDVVKKLPRPKKPKPDQQP